MQPEKRIRLLPPAERRRDGEGDYRPFQQRSSLQHGEQLELLLAALLSAQERVLGVERNSAARAFKVPDDEFYPSLWNYHMHGLEGVWNAFPLSTYQPTVAVLDTGAAFTLSDLSGAAGEENAHFFEFSCDVGPFDFFIICEGKEFNFDALLYDRIETVLDEFSSLAPGLLPFEYAFDFPDSYLLKVVCSRRE